MNADEIDKLWIGDRIRSIKSGRQGRFEGRHASGKIRMSTSEGVMLVPAKYLELLGDEHVEEDEFLNEFQESIKSKPFEFPSEEIDLHIEKLKPSLANALPERILDIQLKAFDQFMEESRVRNSRKILIIHGRGAGVLRQHIHEALRSYPGVVKYNLVNNDGATEVYFS